MVGYCKLPIACGCERAFAPRRRRRVIVGVVVVEYRPMIEGECGRVALPAGRRR